MGGHGEKTFEKIYKLQGDMQSFILSRLLCVTSTLTVRTFSYKFDCLYSRIYTEKII